MRTAVIRTFDNYFSAHILKTRLEDAGITCYLFDENTITINPIWGRAIGAIKLVVEESDIPKTQALLSEYDREYLAKTVCPNCKKGSFIQIPKQSPGNILTSVLTWAFSSYAISVTNIYQCNNCGYETETLPEETENDVTT